MVVTFQHKVGEYDDATGPIRTRKVKKATNLTLNRGDIVALSTGLAIKAINTGFGPFGVVKHTVLAAEAKARVEIYIDTKATIYVKTGASIKAETYAKIDSNSEPVPVVPGTDVDPLKIFGRYVRDGATNYDGVTDLPDSVDDGIGGFILGLQ